jgi:hypothetical protein
MYEPTIDTRDKPAVDSSRSIAASYATVPIALLLLWAVSQPLAGAATLVAVVGVAVGVERLSQLLRCFRACGGFTLDLGDRARISVTQPDCCRAV